MKTFIIFSILCLTAISSIAQPLPVDSLVDKPKHFEENVFGIGLHASLVTGMGVSFRHRIAGTSFAYQLNAGILKLSSSLLYSIGGEFQYDLTSGASNRVYAIVGAGHYYTGDSTEALTTPTRIGAGVGYEFPVAKQIGVSVALLVMGFLPHGDILPLPQIGCHYFFK
jgi:hypothetical protein